MTNQLNVILIIISKRLYCTKYYFVTTTLKLKYSNGNVSANQRDFGPTWLS